MQLLSGRNLTSIDISIPLFGTISGTVTDENQEPVPDIAVMLIAREYSSGIVRNVYAGLVNTDDQGHYQIKRVAAGRHYLIKAEKRTMRIPAVSDAPADPELRKRVAAPVYYPDSPSLEGAQPIALDSRENREHVDFRLPRVPSHCIAGVLKGENGPAAMTFGISFQIPVSGEHGGMGMFVSDSSGNTGADGKFRICGLSSGDYWLTAWQRSDNPAQSPTFYGKVPVTIGKDDLENVHVDGAPQLAIPGEVVWAGKPPDQPITEKLAISVRPYGRAPFMGETSNTDVSLPGEFRFPRLMAGDYRVDLFRAPSGVYVKDLTYGGVSILNAPLKAGSTIGDVSLRIFVANDGGTVSTKVADKDGNPVPDANVVVVPFAAPNEGALAESMIQGQTDQTGAWQSRMVAPGKYYVLATTTRLDKSPETIQKLWQARTTASEVEVAPNGTASVAVVPKLLQ